MNITREENISGERNISSFEDCENCELDECAVGLSTASMCIFVSLSVLCGVSAVVGNLALLAAIFRTEALRRVSNYFMVSLAVADFLIGLTMTPLYVCYAVVYDSPYWLIKLESFLWIVTVAATTYSLSAVSLDRCISVVYPLRYHAILTEKRCCFAIALIWFGSIVLASPRLFIDDFTQLEKLWIACSALTVAIPLSIIAFTYGTIFSVVRKQNRAIADNTQGLNHASIERAGNRKAAGTIGIIVSLFIVTFAPSVVVYFLLLFEDDECKELELNDVWLWVALVSFVHSSCNPWVYGLRTRELRNALKNLVVSTTNYLKCGTFSC